MELQVRNPGVDYMIERVLDFQSEDTSDFWSAPLYHFYPQLDRAYAAALPWQERKAYFSQVLRQIYAEEESIIEDKVKSYGAHWASCKEQITQALSDAFAIDCNAILNDMVCNVSLNPIEPRFCSRIPLISFIRTAPMVPLGRRSMKSFILCGFTFGISYLQILMKNMNPPPSSGF